MENHNTDLGRRGEQAAAEYLSAERFEIVARNFRAGRSEIDIIARDAFSLRFVEVKARMEGAQESILVSLHSRKTEALKRGAYAFLSEHHDLNDLEIFFDLITVIFSVSGAYRIEYIPDFVRF